MSDEIDNGEEKGVEKGEVVLMPLKEGIVGIDDWVPEPEDIIFGYSGKIVIVPFDKLFNRKSSKMFNNFYISFKESYYKRLEFITKHINYFIKFYDQDQELINIYLHLKYMVDLKTISMKRSSFIDILIRCMFTDTMIDKIKRMCADNYRADITAQNNKSKIQYPKSLEFNNKHGEIMMRISVAIKMLIPIVLHYISIRKSKKEIERLQDYYLPLFKILNDDVNILGKLYHTIFAKVNVSKKGNVGVWSKHAANGDSAITVTENLLYKNIIVDLFFQYSFVGNTVAFNSVILGRQLGYYAVVNLGVDYNEISTDKDSEGLSSLDYFTIVPCYGNIAA